MTKIEYTYIQIYTYILVYVMYTYMKSVGRVKYFMLYYNIFQEALKIINKID